MLQDSMVGRLYSIAEAIIVTTGGTTGGIRQGSKEEVIVSADIYTHLEEGGNRRIYTWDPALISWF